MIDAEMYGMMPRPKIVLCDEVPPNMATVPKTLPEAELLCMLLPLLELAPGRRSAGGCRSRSGRWPGTWPSSGSCAGARGP